MKLADYIGKTTAYDKKLMLERKDPISWLKSVSAFANTHGGKLLYGVSDSGDLIGLAMLADLRYLKGDGLGALDIIGRAEQLEPPSVDQALRVCESMAHFMDHEQHSPLMKSVTCPLAPSLGCREEEVWEEKFWLLLVNAEKLLAAVRKYIKMKELQI